MIKRLPYIIVVALGLVVLPGCTIGYKYLTPEKKTPRIVFKGFYLDLQLWTMDVEKGVDSIPFASWMEVRYKTKIRDTPTIDTLGVVYIDSLCYHFMSSKDSICPIPRWSSDSLYINRFWGNANYGLWWHWTGMKIPASGTLLDVSFVAVLRHPKTGEELARERFTVRLKRFNDNRFVIFR